MHRELYPEVSIRTTQTESGRHVTEHTIDKFPRHWDQLHASYYFGADGSKSNGLSAVRFQLPFSTDKRVYAQPFFWVVGTGVSYPNIYAQGVYREGHRLDLEHLKSNGRTAWEVVDQRHEDQPQRTRIRRLDEWPKQLIGIPTINIPPFMGGIDFVPGMLRRYNIMIGSGSELIQVEASLDKEPENETVDIRYIFDHRENRAQEIAKLKHGEHGWVIAPRYSLHRYKAA